MKTKWERLPKGLRLALLLALMALMVLCLWLHADTPRLSPQGALREAEQRGLLEPGEYLTHRFDFPEWGFDTDYFVAVSRTKTRLHTVELYRKGFLWESNDGPVTVAIEQPVTAILLPWQANIENNLSCYPAAVVYCTDPAAAEVTGTLTIDDRTFSGRAGKGENGCWLVAFESLYEQEMMDYGNAFTEVWSYHHWNRPIEGHVIRVEITVFDQNGSVLARKTMDHS